MKFEVVKCSEEKKRVVEWAAAVELPEAGLCSYCKGVDTVYLIEMPDGHDIDHYDYCTSCEISTKGVWVEGKK